MQNRTSNFLKVGLKCWLIVEVILIGLLIINQTRLKSFANGPSDYSVGYPVIDDDPTDNLYWDVPFNYFGNWYEAMGGYHSGEDWNLVGGDPIADLNKPVYTIAEGKVAKISNLGSLGYLIALEHNTTLGYKWVIPRKQESMHEQTYRYETEYVTKFYSIYIHVIVREGIAEGVEIQKGERIGYIMNPGRGPHLHFEIRHPDAKHSNNWSMVGDPSNWAKKNRKYTGYYLDIQKMVDGGVRGPRDFIQANQAPRFAVKAHPVITAPLKITPPPSYHAGDRINAEFTITNKGTAPITFNILTVGGHDPDGQVADFTFRRDITLNPNQSYNYEGTLTLTKAGNYHFFCAYQTPDGKWNTSVDLGAGLTDEDRIEDILVTLNNVALGKPCTVITNGAEDYSDGHPGEWPRDITGGRLAYQPVSSGKEDGCIAWQNEDHDELFVVTVTIDLGATHNITKIRYNPGNCERAETWNADIMESPFGKTPTNPGSPYQGTWTEQTGSITTSKVTIKLEKTRRSWATDWLFIGEIEVWGTSIE